MNNAHTNVAYKCSLTVLAFTVCCAARASAQGSDWSRLATPADSVPLTTPAAEQMGARWSKPAGPIAALPSDAGSGNRTCADATANVMHTGDFVSYGWSEYQQEWHTGYGKIMWKPTGQGRPDADTLTVRTVRLDAPGTTTIFRIPPTPTHAAPGFIFPSGVPVPSTGKWMFIATAGNNWGCVLFTLQ